MRIRQSLWCGAAVVVAALVGSCQREAASPRAAGAIGVAAAMGGSDAELAGFARATARPELRFPRDHGAHPEFRTEWWYWTGNLRSESGRRFGVQLVFFRQALAADVPERAAALATRDMMLAHAAVTDVDGKRFHHAERTARATAGLGGVVGPTTEQPFGVFAADWSARGTVGGTEGGDGFLPTQLRAADDTFGFELEVRPGKPIVLQGDGGLSQKSAAPGNASIYYSMTRLPMLGTITVAGVAHAVRGEGWLDREWSTSALGADQVGWDWFSLQFDDGCELMWYSLRRADGSSDPWSRGTLVLADGSAVRLAPERVVSQPEGRWTAADGRASYPARWRLRGRDPDFDVEVVPLLADQELRTIVRYWEGAVEVRGTREGRAVRGVGYLEMTGYDQIK